MTPNTQNTPFAPTRWTLVLRAQGNTRESQTALSELCEAYYQPVLRFLQREGRAEDEARELTHSFFAKLLERPQLHADPRKGRFRSYLLGTLKHFLANERKAANRHKRGSGINPDSLDAQDTTSRNPEPHDPRSNPDDTFFDRQWALTLMDRALTLVRNEFVASDKTTQFDTLKPWLVGDAQELKQSQAASQLGLSETAVKVAIHRLRKRFKQTLHNEIAQTIGANHDVDDELRYLAQILTNTSNT